MSEVGTYLLHLQTCTMQVLYPAPDWPQIEMTELAIAPIGVTSGGQDKPPAERFRRSGEYQSPTWAQYPCHCFKHSVQVWQMFKHRVADDGTYASTRQLHLLRRDGFKAFIDAMLSCSFEHFLIRVQPHLDSRQYQ